VCRRKSVSEKTTDPLNAYDGRDRVLREAIENVLIKAIGDSDMRQGWRGTLPLANEIMARQSLQTGASRSCGCLRDQANRARRKTG
jgi:hypothetical protein